jgi:hypothetical protein
LWRRRRRRPLKVIVTEEEEAQKTDKVLFSPSVMVLAKRSCHRSGGEKMTRTNPARFTHQPTIHSLLLIY